MSTKSRPLLVCLAGCTLSLAVLGGACSPAVGRTGVVAAHQSDPSAAEVCEVLRLLPGRPDDWLFPGSVPRSVSYQPATMADPTPTRLLVLETKAGLPSVRAYYDEAVARSGRERLDPPKRPGRFVLRFRGGSVLIGRERGITLIVLVAEEQPFAKAPSN
jgi:hypothetical protein